MPIYDFRHKETGEIIEKILSLSAYEEFVNEHPEYERYLGNQVNPLGDPHRMGLVKKDNGFKEVLSKVHERTPGSKLNTVADF